MTNRIILNETSSHVADRCSVKAAGVKDPQIMSTKQDIKTAIDAVKKLSVSVNILQKNILIYLF